MGEGEMAADVWPLEEPYQRFPCNQLRRECYRRKLPVIKSGPQTNATKAGFLRLLRESDAQTDSTKESEVPSANDWKKATMSMLTIEPEPFVHFPAPPPRVVSPPTSPMAFVQVLPTRPPRVDVGPVRSVKRETKYEEDVAISEKKRQKIKNIQLEQPTQPMSDGSFFSTQTSSSAVSVSDHPVVPPLLPLSVEAEHNKIDTVESMALLRWERLHARLEAVTTKLLELHGRRDEWPPSPVGTNDDSDVVFYELMRKQLQRSLLECVSHT